jgi:alpha-tubulin suppressor-like RCC1 family protein
MRAGLLLVAALALGCTDWERFSRDYAGPGVCPTYVVAGDVHTCIRRSNGDLLCWGDNRFGQLGTGDTVKHTSPTRIDVAGLGTLKIYVPTGTGDITTDLTAFTCALASDNVFRCWGDNRYGQLGTGDTASALQPVPVKGLAGTVSKATNGAGHSCVLTTDGVLSCWGRNLEGQLGIGGTSSQPIPVVVNLGRTVERLAAGGAFTCAAGTDAVLFCWGANTQGQLGLGSTDAQTKPVQVTALGTRTGRLAAGGAHACVSTADDGQVWCWGDNSSGQLGTGDTDRRLVPTPVDPQGLGAVKTNQVFAGGSHTCALRDDNTLWCWGGNRSGQLGTGDTQAQLLPRQVLADVTAAYTGGAHTCAIRTDGSVWCWGNNQYGQLGLDVGSQSASPGRVSPPCQ